MRRFLLILLLSAGAHGQSLDNAVREIAKNLLAPGEVSHVSEHTLAPEFAAETARARMLLERALRRPAPRDARFVEVVVTATENVSGPLLVVEIMKGDDRLVETAAYVSQAAARAATPALVTTLLWQQAEPILDLTLADDVMLVLSPGQIDRLKRVNGKWEAIESAALESPAPSRDPRGRLAVTDDTVSIYFSGATCAGKWTPSLQLDCSQSTGEFQAEGEQIHFVSGQNTLETASGEAFYSISRAGDFRLIAAADGKVHATRGQQAFEIPGWGSDIAGLPAKCLANPVVVVSSSLAAAESLTAYEITGANPRRIGDPLPVQGSVTALWPTAAPGSVLAVAHDSATGRYAAYLVSLDCGN